MDKMRKVTVMVPRALIEAVQDGTGKGISATVREALDLLYQRHVQNPELRGKVKFSMTMDQLRHDRE